MRSPGNDAAVPPVDYVERVNLVLDHVLRHLDRPLRLDDLALQLMSLAETRGERARLTDIRQLASTENDVHTGEIETATTLAQRPHLVPMDRAKKFVLKFSSEDLDFTSSRSVERFAHMRQISRSGVLGDTTRASAERAARRRT